MMILLISWLILTSYEDFWLRIHIFFSEASVSLFEWTCVRKKQMTIGLY